MRSILRRMVIGLAGLGLLTSGCSGFTYSGHDVSGQDVRVKASGDTLYLLARTTGVSRNLSAGLGGDAARVAARPVSTDVGNMLLMQIDGCYTVRRVIVSSESDAPCVA